MNVEITGRHVVITPALRTYILKRLRKFNRLIGDDASLHVIIDVAKQRHTAEIVLKSKLMDVTGRGQTSDMYASILRAIEKLEKQTIRQKSRMIEGKRQRARAQAVQEKVGRGRAEALPLGAMERLTVEEIEHKPMTIEEAILEVGESKYPFVVFRDSETGAVNVLYRRPNGALSLIRG